MTVLMEDGEAEERLRTITEAINRYINEKGDDLPIGVHKFLCKITHISEAFDKDDEEVENIADHLNMTKPAHSPKVIISCDASIKKNPGGPASVGYVIEYKDEKPLKHAVLTSPKTITCNQAEYDAVYTSLTTLMNLKNNPQCEVEVRSDSRLVVEQLNKRMQCNDPILLKKRDLILEYISELPVPVVFVWYPRNSTPELEEANFLCQDLLGVPRH